MAAGRTPRSGIAAFRRSYLSALRAHVEPEAEPRPGVAGRLGLRACALGIETLALARIHDTALAAPAPPGPVGARARGRRAFRAATFFAEALAPIESSHRVLLKRGAVELASAQGRLTRETGRRRVAQEALATNKSAHRVLIEQGAVELASAQGRLVRESDRRRVAQKALSTSEHELLVALDRSRGMEEELRQLSRNLLNSQEEERKRISRELHDALGQTLTAVNVGLASMKSTASADPDEFRRSVARTQRLVQKSMRTVHQFARHLRPALLDDLGLVPALLSFVQDFGRRNGLKASVSAPEESAQLDGDRRTALFRVAQEALVNVGRHAGARNVRVTFRRISSGVRLEVWNDGTPFDVDRALLSRTNRHLGLLCMRERMEMVGGTFTVRSSKKDGTTVQADVPLPKEAA